MQVDARFIGSVLGINMHSGCVSTPCHIKKSAVTVSWRMIDIIVIAPRLNVA
ncbi:hypothetical protein N483_14825 [Pseudoalteromonas luteoviolacea NCIMB 1944]|nr:hypothetical protein N483_14825 [Pseudoalteromonas luteoviolacea NCIMB 1944]